MMTTLLDALHALGQWAWEPLWVPILGWTALALPLWLFLKHTGRLHPLAEYRLSQVLLATLPAGLLASVLLQLFPESAAVAKIPEVTITAVPSLEAAEVETTSGPTWTWLHAVGLLTAVAFAAGLASLWRLALGATAAARAYATADSTSVENISVKEISSDGISTDGVSLEGISDDAVQAEADRLAKRVGTSRPVRACLSPEAVVPLTLGVPRPLVLLPVGLAEKKGALRLTLAHECVHIRRYDDVAHFVERLVAALFAAHPLVKGIIHHIAEARERACDAAVLEEDRETSPSDYARLLYAFAEGTRPDRLGALSLSESPSSLTNRLQAMRYSVSRLLSSPLSLGAALLGLGLVVTIGVAACSDSLVGSSPGPSAETTTAESATAKSSAEESSEDEPSEDKSSSTLDGEEIYIVVEEQPKLIGGMEALQKAVSYPEAAREAGIEGRVFVQFIVDQNGEVRQPEVTRSVHDLLDEAAIEAVKKQEFEPGKQRGEPVNVRMSVPVTFKLPGESGDSGDEPTASSKEVSSEASAEGASSDEASAENAQKDTEALPAIQVYGYR